MDKNIITYPLFENFLSVIAFTTCRQTFSMQPAPRFTGRPKQQTRRNRERLAEILNIHVTQLVFPLQTHTNNVVPITIMPREDLVDTDGLVTNQAGLCICIQTADCVPILFYDPVKNVVGVAHAGWRGTVGLIAGKVIGEMQRHYRCSPNDIRAVIGPSIGPEVYEVGDEIVNAVRENIPDAHNALVRRSAGKYHVNLWEANRLVLKDCGLTDKNIEITGRCTYTEKDSFFSARLHGIQTGRLVSGIMIKKVLH